MFVIRVMSTCEIFTKKLLEDKGYNVLCPRKLKNEKGKKVERIIFTGYLFIDLMSVSDRDYYKIKDTVNVIGFLDSKYSLSKTDEEFIRLLDNGNKAIEKIDVSFDENKKAIVYMNDNDKYINTKNVVRVNARDKTITFKFKIRDEIRCVTLNYNEIEM